MVNSNLRCNQRTYYGGIQQSWVKRRPRRGYPISARTNNSPAENRGRLWHEGGLKGTFLQDQPLHTASPKTQATAASTIQTSVY